MLRIQTILIPTDFSPGSEPALDVAHSLTRDHQARLILMNVVLPPPVREVALPDAEMAGLVAGAKKQLAVLAARFSDLPVETHAVVGDAGHAIVETAREAQADLIVMGTQGRSGVTRFLLGSVAEHVLRHAPCPVLTVKPGTESHLRNDLPSDIAVGAPS